ncbi:hypothetical protein [Sorangium sp. So ce1151]|uniref:hypothetical protein n=1 Tax=Sorangium sp. So ce1151 TaxID=3133332 RepID=UPI003F5E09C7
MKTIEAAVTSKLRAQRGHEEALALWKALWAAYESGGVEGAQAHLDGLCELPENGDDADEEEVDS